MFNVQGNIFVVRPHGQDSDNLDATARELGLEPKVFESLDAFLAFTDEESTEGCVVADLDAKPSSHRDVIETVRTRRPRTVLIGVTQDVATNNVVQAMRRGCFSILSKPILDSTFAQEVEAALRCAERHAETHRWMVDIRNRLGQLSDEETRILNLVMDGTPNKSIANQMGLSTRTIENRRRQLYDKMGTYCVAQLVKVVTEYQVRQSS